MKIWYQVVSNIERRPTFVKAMQDIAKASVDRGTTIEFHGTRTGLSGEQYHSVRYMDIVGVLANAIAAEKQGFDVFTIGNTLDAGIRECRELVNIPVVGHLQTALSLTSMMADKFSVITTHQKFVLYLAGLIKAYGYGDNMVSIDGLDVEVANHDKLYTDKKYGEARLERVVDFAKKGVASGAQMILLLPPSIYVGLTRMGITEIDGAPILNTTAGVIKMSELMVKFRKITGMFISRKVTYELPPKELVNEVIARHKLVLGA